jgi:hypothetical protein
MQVTSPIGSCSQAFYGEEGHVKHLESLAIRVSMHEAISGQGTAAY